MAAAAVLGSAVVVVLGGVGPATAATEVPAPVPADVREWFAGSAEDRVEAVIREAVSADGEPPYAFEDVEVGEPWALHTWTDDFASGRATEPVLQPRESWIAALTADGAPVGTVVADRTAASDGSVDMVWFGDDAEVAVALEALDPGAALVHEERLDVYLAVDGTDVVPLHPRAVGHLPAATPLAEYQADVQRRYEEDHRVLADGSGDLAGGGAGEAGTDPADGDGDGDGDGWWAAGAGVLALGGLAVVLGRRRRRSSAAAAPRR